MNEQIEVKESVLLRKDWDVFFEQCLQVLAKYGYTPDEQLASSDALENFAHYCAKHIGRFPTALPNPWYKKKCSALLEYWVEGMLCDVEKDNLSPFKKIPKKGVVDNEHIRKMTFECAMILTTHKVRVGPYNESLNSLSAGLHELLLAMNYESTFHPGLIHPWSRFPEWEEFKVACENNK